MQPVSFKGFQRLSNFQKKPGHSPAFNHHTPLSRDTVQFGTRNVPGGHEGVEITTSEEFQRYLDQGDRNFFRDHLQGLVLTDRVLPESLELGLAELQSAKWTKVTARNTDFLKAEFQGPTEFHDCHLQNSIFGCCILYQDGQPLISFKGSDLQGADFRSAHVSTIQLTEAASVRGAFYSSHTCLFDEKGDRLSSEAASRFFSQLGMLPRETDPRIDPIYKPT